MFGGSRRSPLRLQYMCLGCMVARGLLLPNNLKLPLTSTAVPGETLPSQCDCAGESAGELAVESCSRVHGTHGILAPEEWNVHEVSGRMLPTKGLSFLLSLSLGNEVDRKTLSNRVMQNGRRVLYIDWAGTVSTRTIRSLVSESFVYSCRLR